MEQGAQHNDSLLGITKHLVEVALATIRSGPPSIDLAKYLCYHTTNFSLKRGLRFDRQTFLLKVSYQMLYTVG